MALNPRTKKHWRQEESFPGTLEHRDSLQRAAPSSHSHDDPEIAAKRPKLWFGADQSWGNQESTDETVPSAHYHELLARIQDKSALVAVVGLGYVGLPLSAVIHESGFRVLGYDVDTGKINKLKLGTSYIVYIEPAVWDALKCSERFIPTNQVDQFGAVDIFILCLPTPVGSHHEPDMRYVFDAVKTISKLMKRGCLIILESTTYPGTTDSDVVRLLVEGSKEKHGPQGLQPGDDFFVAFSPEREDPANKEYTAKTIPKLVGGSCAFSGKLAVEFYRSAGFQPVGVRSARVAECAKLLENIYRSVNIALVNELKMVFQAMGVDIWDVLDAAATKPFGYQRFNPGPGIGGHCIPVDPFYLSWKAKEFGQRCDFIELAAKVNASMPLYVVERIKFALNDVKKAVNGSRILLLGIAFKANVDDMRESPALEIWDLLDDLGAEIHFHDPYIPVIPPSRKHSRLTQVHSIPWSEQQINDHDCVVAITNHSNVDYGLLEHFAGVVIDTRNVIPKFSGLKLYRA
mmetsp:Transcript_262/g.462  ORF Transcript_262/g.462 Transcript_262/m.462 type:complete len:517 (-) Transcript_262:444-1994(-)